MGHGSFGQGRLWVFEAAKSEEEFSIRRKSAAGGGFERWTRLYVRLILNIFLTRQ